MLDAQCKNCAQTELHNDKLAALREREGEGGVSDAQNHRHANI